MTRPTIRVEGSHGHLLVDKATGVILARESCGPAECEDCAKFGGYATILFFDPLGWDDCAHTHGETDILCTSFVDKVGYARAMGSSRTWAGKDYGVEGRDDQRLEETELLTYQPLEIIS